MTLSKKAYKGTRDCFPPLKRELDYLFTKMADTAELFSYEPYDGPLVEEVALYKAKSGDELINDQIYSFYDRGERLIAIRPEMTPTLARMIANVHKELPRPIRWYSIPNLMRYERPQKGRLREHWQFNCDIFGAPEYEGEIEILQIAISLLESFGADDSHFEILINDRKVVEALFHKVLKLAPELSYQLYKIIDKAKKITNDKLGQLLGELNLDANASKLITDYLNCNSFPALCHFLQKINLLEEQQYIENFLKRAEESHLFKYLKYDPTIVRGLDYYTGIVFEMFDKHPANKRAICGGGRYENLLQIFNEAPLAGVGLGLGEVTLKDFLKGHQLLADFSRPQNDLLITFQTTEAKKNILNMAGELRKANFKVLTIFEKIKYNKAFSLAEKKGAAFVILCGEDEMKTSQIKIKSLITKEQDSFLITEVSKIVNFMKKN